jgi:hypothetical protein
MHVIPPDVGGVAIAKPGTRLGGGRLYRGRRWVIGGVVRWVASLDGSGLDISDAAARGVQLECP